MPTNQLTAIARTLSICLLICMSLINAQAQCNQPTIYLGNQAAVNSFKSSYGCTTMTGILTISGADITNLDSLHQLTEVGELHIQQTNAPNLEGLSSLTRVHGILNIYWNYGLTTLHGIEQLEKVGALTVYNNDLLTNLQGLDGLHVIEGNTWIADNSVLQSMHGLNGLDSIHGQLYIDENDFLQNLSGLDNLISANEVRIEQNPSLYSLTGLENLTTLPNGLIIFLNLGLVNLGNFEKLEHVGQRLWITFNPLIESLEGLHVKTITGAPIGFDHGLMVTQTKITSLHGLESLERVEGRIYIGQNAKLKTLEGLENLQLLIGHLGIEDNYELESIDAIANLPPWQGELELTDNDSLSYCSVPSICRYIDAPTDLLLLWGNGPNCMSPEEVSANCSPIIDFDLVEANLNIDDSPSTGEIEQLPLHELVSLSTMRAGIATDGVSKVLLRMTTGAPGRMHVPNAAEQGLSFPWGDSTYYFDGKNYFFALYTAPDEFDELEDIFSYGTDNIDAYNTAVNYEFTINGEVRNNALSITHVRPPVVLVHGTYSNPDQTWKTPVANGQSFYDRLIGEGFKPFTVNYQPSNGTVSGADISSFQHNARILWGDVYPENTGGIKDALHYYRNTLGVAVTQADVIGHSLGGILPRVYASSHYNPQYKNPVNFNAGDINRLITLGSTHFGSHLGELQLFLDGLSPFDIGALDWLALQGVNLITQWVGGASASLAVMDQLPPPNATSLSLLGRTEVPSHAITLRTPAGALRDTVHDPDESYYDMYWYTTTLMYQVHDVRTEYLNSKLELIEEGLLSPTTLDGGSPQELYPQYTNTMLFKSMIEDGLQLSGSLFSVLDGSFEPPTDLEIYKYAFAEAGMGDIADPLLDVFVAGADPVGVALDYLLPEVQFPTVQSIIEDQLMVTESSMEALRSLIFNNDDNDGVVRVQSQSGQLENECPSCVTQIDSVLHGFAPRYQKVQDRMVDLLRGDFSLFAEQGFPAVEQAQPLYYPSEELDVFKVPVSGGAAICQSGMVPAHARAFAHVADERNVIIMTRPVNPDGTDHLIRHAATKGMDIKPKSANWGPQKGFIPVEQRYSKLWKVFEGDKRTEKIIQYNQLAQDNLNEGTALTRPLIVSACDKLFHVYVDESRITGPEDVIPEDEIVLVPMADLTKVCTWGDDFSTTDVISDCEDIGPQHDLVPLPVFASPIVFEEDGTTPRFLTADYDLLMVGFYAGPDQGDPSPPVLEFQPGVGQITPDQLTLLGLLNDAVAETGYRGGKVVHHGPENQFTKSPYIDYPITVFAPDRIPNGLFNQNTDGLILSIEMGPPGFRDLYLKQFVNRMRKEGYDLYHNPPAPGWKWTWDSESQAYELEDHKDLGDYIEELPKQACDKYGSPIEDRCALAYHEPDDASRPGPASNTNSIPDFSVEPTIVFDRAITLHLSNPEDSPLTWLLVDQFGQVITQGVAKGKGNHDIPVELAELGPGMYSVVVGGKVKRVLKM
jgi:pimeloyl-ACP methyl ester carboxylesterase